MATRSRANGSQPIQRLAEALRPREEQTAELAAALQDCLNSAVERGAQRAKEEIKAEFGPRFDQVDARLDKQDDTLRLFWEHMKGDPNQRLPIDD